jgi:hypothetical protein
MKSDNSVKSEKVPFLSAEAKESRESREAKGTIQVWDKLASCPAQGLLLLMGISTPAIPHLNQEVAPSTTEVGQGEWTCGGVGFGLEWLRVVGKYGSGGTTTFTPSPGRSAISRGSGSETSVGTMTLRSV